MLGISIENSLYCLDNIRSHTPQIPNILLLNKISQEQNTLHLPFPPPQYPYHRQASQQLPLSLHWLSASCHVPIEQQSPPSALPLSPQPPLNHHPHSLTLPIAHLTPFSPYCLSSTRFHAIKPCWHQISTFHNCTFTLEGQPWRA